MWNVRVGMKVVCINDAFPKISCMPNLAKKDGIYTVREIVDDNSPVALIERALFGIPNFGFLLREITNPVCNCLGKENGFHALAFRPLVEDESKTDISALLEIAKTAQVPADVKIPEKV